MPDFMCSRDEDTNDKASTEATSDIKVEIDRLDQARRELVRWRRKP
jgi:hypothetical protein